MAESLHHQGNIIAQKSKDGKWCVCVSLHVLRVHACGCERRKRWRGNNMCTCDYFCLGSYFLQNSKYIFYFY